jgi:adenine-specific DNA-methyltransferase
MTNEPERVETTTPDLAAEKLAALKELFPGAVADGVLDAARIGELVDLPVAGLKDGRERYGLMWAGKQEAVASLLRPSRGTLVPDLERSVDFENARNVFIEGDNLEVLKILQKAYNDQIKLIYIDPPYNTGGDLIYHDDFRDPVLAYLMYAGLVDSDGRRLQADSSEEGRLHSRWLSMMYPRLALGRNLLRQDGVLLCSINDVEQANLKQVLDEVFGPENFLGQFLWVNDGNIEQQSSIKVNHEYVLAYARSKDSVLAPSVIDPNIEDSSKLFNSRIENSITKNGPKNPPSVVTLPVGFPASVETSFEIAPRSDSFPRVLDPVIVNDGRLAQAARLESGWSSRRLLDLFIANGFVPIEDAEGKETWFAVTPTGAIYGYKSRRASQGHVLTVLKNMGTTKSTSSRLSRDWGLDFDFPKPEKLIQYLISIFTSDSDLIVDFFAGSGTTAHAVALQNRLDSARRRYLLVNLPEPVRPGSKADAAGFRTISEMTLHRLKHVMDEIPSARADGLRVLKMDEGVSASLDDSDGQLAMNELSLRENARSDAIAQDVLLREGVRLDRPWSVGELGGAERYSAGGVTVVTDRNLTTQSVDAAIESNPRVLVFLEDAFAGKDDLKASAYFACKQAGVTMKTV